MELRFEKLLAAAFAIAMLIVAAGCTKKPNDSALTEQIQSKLSQDSGLQGKAITVETAGGVVTLSGNVGNDAQRVAASRYASATAGVSQVVNNLVVAGAAQKPPAVETAQAAPAAKPMAEAKPRPSKPQRVRKKDPSEWDTADSDSNSNSSSANSSNGNDAAAANQTVDAMPASTPLAAAVAAAAVAPPPPPPPKQLTIQSGTTIAVRLIDAIDSETSQQGETFRATLDSPLASNGEVAIPAGYKVEGHVVDVKSAGKFAGQSLLVLQLDRVSASGKSYSLQTDQYKRQGTNRSTNTAEKVGAGAVIGAIIGGLAGGGKGAGIGAAAGGGVGGGVQAATKGQQIKLPSETVLNFTLQAPVTVTQVEKGPEAGRPKLDSPQ